MRWIIAPLIVLAGCPAPTSEPTETPQPAPSEPANIRIIGFNDFHGALLPRDGDPPLGGAAYLATHIEALRTDASVVVAAGDLIGASPLLSSMLHDEPAIDVLDAIGLDFAAVGNHEFDEGPAELLRMQEGGCHPVDGCKGPRPFDGASFRYLAANVWKGEQLLFPAKEIVTLDGLPVGIIGMTLEGTPSVTTPAGVAGLTFHDEVETANALVPELREAGAETIVVVVHEGGITTGEDWSGCENLSGPIIAIAEALDPAIDVLITGHTHQAYVCEVAGKTVTSAGASGLLVTHIDLTVDRTTGEILAREAVNHLVTHDVEPNAAIQTLVDEAKQAAAPLTERVVGSLTASISRSTNEAGESVLGDLIADAQLAAGSQSGSQIAFMNPGGIRADLAEGEVRFEQVFAVHPFENRLVTLTLTGAQIHDLLEAQWREGRSKVLQISSGSSYTWHAERPIGDRVDPEEIVIAGKKLDPSKSYRVTVNDFLGSGGDGFEVLREGTDAETHGTDAEALDAYLAEHSPYSPEAAERIRRTK